MRVSRYTGLPTQFVSAQAYREIAERHLEAARLVLEGGLPEIAIFHCYHAFESIACAALVQVGVAIPRRHQTKVERFLLTCRALPYGRGAAAVAVLIAPLRNRTLYPDLNPLAGPQDSFSQRDAEDLVRRVGGIVRTVIAAERL